MGNLSRHFTKEDIWMTKKTFKKHSVSSGEWEEQVNTTIKYHYKSIRKVKIKRLAISDVVKDIQKPKLYKLLVGASNDITTLERGIAVSYKNKDILNLWFSYPTTKSFPKINEKQQDLVIEALFIRAQNGYRPGVHQEWISKLWYINNLE